MARRYPRNPLRPHIELTDDERREMQSHAFSSRICKRLLMGQQIYLWTGRLDLSPGPGRVIMVGVDRFEHEGRGPTRMLGPLPGVLQLILPSARRAARLPQLTTDGKDDS